MYKPRCRTRKGDITSNALEVYDRNLTFTYVLPGWEGSVVDGRVLRDAIVQHNDLKIPEGMLYMCLYIHITRQKNNVFLVFE